MHISQRKTILSAICIFYFFTVSGQTNQQKFELGLGIGAFIYQGDLTPSRLGSFRTTRPGIQLYGAKILNPSFSLRVNLAVGGLRGDDAKYDYPEYRQQRNFNFRSRLAELSGLLVWNPLRSNYEDKGFHPYLFSGAGLSFVNIRRDWSNYNAEYFDVASDVSARLAEDASQSLPRVIPVIPAGLGLRYNISSRWGVNVESAYRFVFTDYLDGFSKAANPARNDHYSSLKAGIIYRIGKKNMLNCPVVRY